MNKGDLFMLSLRNLMRRKTRTFLAVIGVIVGTSAIVVMLSIGFGLSDNFQKQIESYGNLHLVDVYGGMGSGGLTPDGKPAILDDKAIAEIEKIPGVDAASPQLSTYMTFGLGKYICQTEVTGIRPEVMQKFKYDVQDGRLLRPGDKFSVVFGNQVPMWFQNPKQPNNYNMTEEPLVQVLTDKLILTADDYYGQKRPANEEEEKVTYKEYKVKGVGVLANPGDESSYTVFMPLETVKAINADTAKARKEVGRKNQQGYETAIVYVGDINEVENVSETIRLMGFQPSSLNDWLKQTQDTAKMIQGILGGIGAISLFVAALGIANTMIMSIYERTKEIGVMKVIGANLPDIKQMFLLEAAMIGFIGGVLGLLISYLLSYLLNSPLLSGVLGQVFGQLGGMGGMEGTSAVSIIPWWVAAGSLLFATCIGVLSGYYPARRAMNLSALESLKNE